MPSSVAEFGMVAMDNVKRLRNIQKYNVTGMIQLLVAG